MIIILIGMGYVVACIAVIDLVQKKAGRSK